MHQYEQNMHICQEEVIRDNEKITPGVSDEKQKAVCL
jgi:hypothetical protein